MSDVVVVQPDPAQVVVTVPVSDQVAVTVEPAATVTVEIGGGGGGSGAAQNLYVQPTDPVLAIPGIWVQTGLGPGGNDMTIWVEDGQP